MRVMGMMGKGTSVAVKVVMVMISQMVVICHVSRGADRQRAGGARRRGARGSRSGRALSVSGTSSSWKVKCCSGVRRSRSPVVTSVVLSVFQHVNRQCDDDDKKCSKEDSQDDDQDEGGGVG